MIPPAPSFDAQKIWESPEEAQKVWEGVAERLLQAESGGFATVTLPYPTSSVAQQSLSVVGDVLAMERDNDGHRNAANNNNHGLEVISDTADSAHCTGYHKAGVETTSESSLTNRYNAYRRGLVMSDGAWAVPSQSNKDTELSSLDTALLDLFHVLHTILEGVLSALALQWELPTVEDTDWFQRHMGPTRNNSQWHVKEYVKPPSSSQSATHKEDGPDQEWLPAHTDPSLISVVMHDTTSPGALGVEGLQYWAHDSKQWRNVELSNHDNDKGQTSVEAVVMVGSVLSALTGGTLRACRHRVVFPTVGGNEHNGTSRRQRCRRAVTLFGRPRPTAVMQPLPSPLLQNNVQSKKKPLMFKDWLARVARNYEKSKTSNNGKNSGLHSQQPPEQG